MEYQSKGNIDFDSLRNTVRTNFQLISKMDITLIVNNHGLVITCVNFDKCVRLLSCNCDKKQRFFVSKKYYLPHG